MSQEAVDVVRRIYEATTRGDPAAALALISPDVEIRYRGVVPDLHGRDFHGHVGIAEMLGTITAEFSEFETRAEELHDAGDRVVVVVYQRGTGKLSGAPSEKRVGQVWTVHDGKGVRWEIYRDRDEAMAAAGLSP